MLVLDEMGRAIPPLWDEFVGAGEDGFVCTLDGQAGQYICYSTNNTWKTDLPRPITYWGAISCVPPAMNLPAMVAPSGGVTRVG